MITKIKGLTYEKAIEVVSKLDLENEPVEDHRILHLLAFLATVFNIPVARVKLDYVTQQCFSAMLAEMKTQFLN